MEKSNDQISFSGGSDVELNADELWGTGKAESRSSEYLAQNPYPGLNYYDESREDYFFGRNKEKHEILQMLEIHSLCVIIGKSGIGKSSLINAGLVPELKKRSYVPIKIRINFDVDTNLTQQVKNTISDEIKNVDENAILFEDRVLWEYFQDLKILRGYLKPVLIFDQFEEIFTRGRQRQHELNNLLAELIDLSENRVPEKVQEKYRENNETIPSSFSKDYHIIFSMREDYLPQLTGLRKYIPTLKYSLYRLDQMESPEAFKAVYNPSLKANFLEEKTAWGIVEKIPESKSDEFDFSQIDKGRAYTKETDAGDQNHTPVNKNKKIEPFLLNLLCYSLNEERKAKKDVEARKKISEDDVKKRNFSLIIKEYYEKITGKKYGLSLAIENELITPDGKYRKFSQKDNFIKAGKIKFTSIGKLNEEDIDYLIDNKLIRRKRINDLDYFELIHDILISIVFEKRKARRRRALFLISALLISAFSLFSFFYVDYTQQKQSAELQASIKRLEFDRKQFEFEKQKKSFDSARQEILYVRQKDSLNLVQQQILYARTKDSFQLIQQQILYARQKDSLNSVEQKILLSLQKDSLRLVQEQIKFTHLQDSLATENQKRQMLTQGAINSSKYLARSSKQADYLPAKKTLALLAYDTLPIYIKANIEDYFIEDLYEALINPLSENFKNDVFLNHKYVYKNIDGVLMRNNIYYYSRPFNAITGSDSSEIKEPNLIHTWMNNNGSLIAMELLNEDKKTKSLIIIDSKTKIRRSVINLQLNEEIVSLIFDPTNINCVYATMIPNKEGHIWILKIGSAQTSQILTLEKDEYMFLINKGTREFAAVSNMGKIKFWEDFTINKASTSINLPTGRNRISACCYSDITNSLLVGCVNGEIYTIDGLRNISSPFTYGNFKITTMEISRNGKFLAAGYYRGMIVLWNLESKSAPVVLMNATYPISSLCFAEKSDSLIIATDVGYVYNIPLKISSLINIICKEKKYLKASEWGNYIPDLKYRKIKICD